MSAIENVVNPYDRKAGYIRTNASGFLGTFTQEDEARLNTDMAEANWIAQLSLLDYQNQYNSPEHQAMLMKQAGLNPDLLGLQGTPSADASAPTPTAPAGKSPLETVGQAASIFGTVLSMTNMIAGGAVALSGQLINNDIKNLEKVQKTLGVAGDVASQFRPKPLEDYALTLDDGSIVLDSSRIVADYPFTSLGSNRRNQRNLAKAYERFRESPRTLARYYGDVRKVAEDRMKLGEISSDPRFGATDAEITEAWRPYTKAMAEMTKEMLGAQKSSHRMTRAYNESALGIGLPGMSANADFSERKLQKDQNDLMDRLKGPLYKVAQNLEAKAMDGKQWANYMLIALYTALSAHIGASSSSSFGPQGQSESTNFSFSGFGF